MRIVIALVVLLTTLNLTADAAINALYSPSRFNEAQAAGRYILVDVQASWCASCSLQSPALAKLEKNPTFADLIVFTVDFNLNKDLVKRLGVAVPSTLILLHGRTEVARLAGQSDPKVIEAFIEGVSARAGGRQLSAVSYLLALLAGALSILSPCVLPLVPIVLAAAATSNRLGPLALGAGLVLFFVAIGSFVATVGVEIGVGIDVFRLAGAVVMVVFGLVLAIQPLQRAFERLATPLQAVAGRVTAGVAPSGLAGQFLVGALLGTVWSPCIGPTLGAAIVLASQGKDIGQATLTMFLFGIGTALPLVLIGTASHQTMSRWRKRITEAGHLGHVILGVMLLVLGTLILTGVDRYLETKLLQITPHWVSTLLSSF